MGFSPRSKRAPVSVFHSLFVHSQDILGTPLPLLDHSLDNCRVLSPEFTPRGRFGPKFGVAFRGGEFVAVPGQPFTFVARKLDPRTFLQEPRIVADESQGVALLFGLLDSSLPPLTILPSLVVAHAHPVFHMEFAVARAELLLVLRSRDPRSAVAQVLVPAFFELGGGKPRKAFPAFSAGPAAVFPRYLSGRHGRNMGSMTLDRALFMRVNLFNVPASTGVKGAPRQRADSEAAQVASPCPPLRQALFIDLGFTPQSENAPPRFRLGIWERVGSAFSLKPLIPLLLLALGFIDPISEGPRQSVSGEQTALQHPKRRVGSGRNSSSLGQVQGLGNFIPRVRARCALERRGGIGSRVLRSMALFQGHGWAGTIGAQSPIATGGFFPTSLFGRSLCACRPVLL